MSALKKKRLQPPQHQATQPGKETEMVPTPQCDNPNYRGSGKLAGKVAIITGGDSGIGRATAIAFAKEGAAIVIAYLNETKDAKQTARMVLACGAQCALFAADLGDQVQCKRLVAKTMKLHGQIDILVNNAAEQHPQESLIQITARQLRKTFQTNFESLFFLTQAVLPHLKPGAKIINTASVTAYRGNVKLLDYSATKGAIVTFTRSLSQQLAKDGIYVNAVAPGPVWTPLIVSSYKASDVATFGSETPMGRAGQPFEIAPAFVFLASEDSSFMTGQVLHPNGGDMVGG